MLEGVNPRLIFSVIFIAGLSALMWFDRKNVERHSILFVRRTKRGINLLDKIAKKAPRFWNAYGWTGVFFAFLSIPLMLLQIAWIVNELVIKQNFAAGPSAILPSLSSEATLQAGVSTIPVDYWVISLAIIMVVHEASHGIIARLEDFEINSVGWIVLGIIPGAFVEPKGEQMLPEKGEKEGEAMGLWDQGTYKQRLKVLSAGSWANYVTALVLFILSIGVTMAIASPSIMYEAQEGFPAAEAGMTSGTLSAINGVEIESVQDIRQALEDVEPGDTVTIESSEREEAFEFEAGSREGFEGGYLGLEFRNMSPGWMWFIGLLNMAALLNVLIGMFNMLPAKPLDGGQIVDTLVEEFGNENQRKWVNHFSIVMWMIVLGSLLIGLIM